MLTQLRQLSIAADGRYLRDEELQFMETYLASFDLRLSAYRKIQAAEAQIIRDVEMKMRALDPYLLMRGWKTLVTSGKLTPFGCCAFPPWPCSWTMSNATKSGFSTGFRP